MPAYGNLAARCDELGKEIIAGAEEREKKKPPFTQQDAYNTWYRENDGIFFHARFYSYVANIHNELQAVHVDDPQLDKLIERHERYYQSRQQTDVQRVVKFPEAYHLSIEEIKEIGQRLRFIATQIPR